MSQGSNLTTWKLYWFPALVWLSDIFSWEPALWTVHSQDRVMMWSKITHKWKVLSKKKSCGKKNIDIFTYKQRILSIDMKIKVVKREWMRDWKRERERECVKLGEWLLNIDMKQAQAQGACRNDINRAQFHTIGCGFFISNNAEYRTISIYCGMRMVCYGPMSAP